MDETETHMSDSELNAPDPEANAQTHWLRGLLDWVRLHPLKCGAILGGLVLMSFLAAIGLTLTTEADGNIEAQIKEGFRHLENGENLDAKLIALKLHSNPRLKYEQKGIPTYLIGVATARDAEEEYDLRRRQGLYIIASKYLQESDKRGFPDGYRRIGVYQLGEALYRAKLFQHSLPALERALDLTPENRTRIQEYLAEIHYRLTNLSDEKALEYNSESLADPNLSPDDRNRSLLLRAKILTKLRRYPESLEVLQAIPEDSPMHAESLLVLGQLYLQQADRQSEEASLDDSANAMLRARQKYAEAIAQFRRAQIKDVDGTRIGSEARYFLAACSLRLGDLEEAESRFGDSRRENFDNPLGIAAGLGEAEVQVGLGKWDEAFENYVRIITDVRRQQNFDSPWISMPIFKDRMHKAYKSFLERGDFKRALELAQGMSPPLEKAFSMQLEAETHKLWAENLDLEANLAVAPEKEQLQKRAYRHHRESGLAYAKLAKLRFTEETYPTDVWNAGEQYHNGRDFDRAVALYQIYLDTNNNDRNARAHLRMGESYLAMGKLEDALWSLEQCILLQPEDPDTYRARLIKSQVHLEKNEVDTAIKLLKDNLSGKMTPDADEWRDSLFALGKTFYLEALAIETHSRELGVNREDPLGKKLGLKELKRSHDKFQEAVNTLRQAVLRYKDTTDESIEYRYFLAESHRHSAKWPRKQLDVETINATRFRLKAQFEEDLRIARDLYDELENDLLSEDDRRELSEVENKILRNCFFARGDVNFDLEDWPRAIKAYASASNRYSDQPESLEAFVQIASCYRHMGQFDDARTILKQAKSFFDDRIPKESDFALTTRYNRDEWDAFFSWLLEL